MARPNKTNYSDDDREKRGSYKGKGKNFKGNKGSSRNRNKGRDEQDDATKEINASEWYFPLDMIADQVSELSFQNFLGHGSLGGYEVPSVAVVTLNPCPGLTQQLERSYNSPNLNEIVDDEQGINATVATGKSSANVDGAKIYSLLGSTTGRVSNYQPNDITQMILAIGSFAEWSEHARRFFGLALDYNPRNRTLGKGLIAAMGLDADDFTEKLSVYRMEFNAIISRINQIPLLDNIGFIKKCRDIYQNVYKDDPSSMSQYFVYIPNSYWVLDESADEGGTVLHTVEMDMYQFIEGRTSLLTMREILNALKTMSDALLNSTTLNLVYADLLNMASKIKVPLWRFDYLTENYSVLPMFNLEASLQFHNLTIAGRPVDISAVPGYSHGKKTLHFRDINDHENWITFTQNNDVYSDPHTGEIIYNPLFPEPEVGRKHNTFAVVDVPTDTPTVKDRIEALRYTTVFPNYAYKYLADGVTKKFLMSPTLPDHYAVTMRIFTNITDYSWGGPYSQFIINDVGAGPDDWVKLAQLTQFNYGPIFYNYINGILKGIHGELNFYTSVDYAYLRRVNEYAYLGLFDYLTQGFSRVNKTNK